MNRVRPNAGFKLIVINSYCVLPSPDPALLSVVKGKENNDVNPY